MVEGVYVCVCVCVCAGVCSCPEQSIPVVEASCHPGDVARSLGAMVTDAKNTPGFDEEGEREEMRERKERWGRKVLGEHTHTHTHNLHQPFNHHKNKRCDCRSLHLKHFHPDGNYWFNIHEGIEEEEMEQERDGVCVCRGGEGVMETEEGGRVAAPGGGGILTPPLRWSLAVM